MFIPLKMVLIGIDPYPFKKNDDFVGLRLEDQLKMSLENLCFPRQVAGATEKISMISATGQP